MHFIYAYFCILTCITLFSFNMNVFCASIRKHTRKNARNNAKHFKTTIILRQHVINTTTTGSPDISYDDIYSEWSKWSKCRRRCKQVRTRVCKSVQYCGTTILKEERSCKGDKCQNIKPDMSGYFGEDDSSDFHNRGRGPQSHFRVLYHLQSFVYSQWSEWSSCTKSCRTRRYRGCVMEPICGNSVIQEDAVCYVKGSPCEKIYKRKKRKQRRRPKIDLNNTDSTTNEHRDGRIDDNNCGVPSITNDMASNLRIIGGREATKGKWPWMVSVLNKYHEPFCGGTLISPQFVLTAAHCARRRLYVRTGEHDLIFSEGSEQQIRVSDIFIHPDYDAETVDNDIALLRLRSPLKMNKFTSPACLPAIDDEMEVDSLGTILGWGKRKNSAVFGTDVLHQAQVPIAEMNDCKKMYENYFISPNMLCAGYKRGKVDSCAGDSGGPLLMDKNGKWYIYGITSFGEGCGRKGRYGIYAKVPNFVNWIRETIEKNLTT